jgi:hypothetical protein
MVLGNSGVGTLMRTGGVLTDSGSLVAAGNGTLVLNASTSSVATYFGGQLVRKGAGTLVVVPYNNLMSGNEALSFGQSSTLTNGILGPWGVRESSGTDSSGDYVTLTASGGTYSVGTASYSTGFSGSSGTSVVSLTGSNLLSSSGTA